MLSVYEPNTSIVAKIQVLPLWDLNSNSNFGTWDCTHHAPEFESPTKHVAQAHTVNCWWFSFGQWDSSLSRHFGLATYPLQLGMSLLIRTNDDPHSGYAAPLY